MNRVQSENRCGKPGTRNPQPAQTLSEQKCIENVQSQIDEVARHGLEPPHLALQPKRSEGQWEVLLGVRSGLDPPQFIPGSQFGSSVNICSIGPDVLT